MLQPVKTSITTKNKSITKNNLIKQSIYEFN